MPNPLDTYLGAIEKRLRPMPDAERTAEVEEIRLHIEALSENYQSRGLDADAATNAAIRQLGKARKVGGDIVTAWWRRDEPDPGSFMRAIGTALIWTCAWPMACGLLLVALVKSCGTSWANCELGIYPAYAFVAIAVIGAPITAGWTTGLASPRRSIPAVALVYTALCVTWMCATFRPTRGGHIPREAFLTSAAIIAASSLAALAGQYWLNRRRRFLHQSNVNAGGGQVHD